MYDTIQRISHLAKSEIIDGDDLSGTLLNNTERGILSSMCDQTLMDIVFAFVESALNTILQAPVDDNQVIILHEIREGHIRCDTCELSLDDCMDEAASIISSHGHVFDDWDREQITGYILGTMIENIALPVYESQGYATEVRRYFHSDSSLLMEKEYIISC